MTTGKERILAVIFSIAFAITMIVLINNIHTLTHFQVAFFRALLAVTAAGAAATLPSFSSIDMSAPIRAASALAILFIVFFFNPLLPIVPPGAGG